VLGGRDRVSPASYRILLVILVAVGASIWVLRSDPDRLWLARVLPFSNLIIIGNLTLPAIALVSGMAFRRMSGHVLRRCALLAPLIGLAAFDLVRPLLGVSPPVRNRWESGVCRQTSEYSCSPAGAATLLRYYGIETSEKEMADLCLTREGTATAGIYRGLKLKSAAGHMSPKAFHCGIEELRKSLDSPVILTVYLNKGDTSDPRYEKLWGWAPGVRHTIVLFRFLPNDRIEVGDPGVGREAWNLEALRVLWHGNGILLVRTDR
jgi:hypothetical protein